MTEEEPPPGTPAGQDPRTPALRALAHPLRLQILSLLTGTELSASEVARELGITQANASYHLRVLARSGDVVEAGTATIRGGIAKRYRHPWDRPEPEPTSEDEQGRALVLRTIGQELVRRHALREPHTHNLTVDAEMWVEPAVRDEALDLLTRAARLLHAEARPPRTRGTVRVNLTAAFFQMREGQDER